MLGNVKPVKYKNLKYVLKEAEEVYVDFSREYFHSQFVKGTKQESILKNTSFKSIRCFRWVPKYIQSRDLQDATFSFQAMK